MRRETAKPMSGLARPCIVCGVLIASGSRCAMHPPMRIQHTSDRPPPSERGHDHAYKVMRLRVLARDDDTCRYCGGKADTVDFVQPWSKGGQAAWDNLVAACRTCNSAKRDR